MAETPAEYTKRILSNVDDRDPWEVLTSTPSRLRQLVAGRQDHDLERQPVPGRWSAKQILAHLADAEVVLGWRLRSIVATSGVTLQPFDQNRWAEVFKYEQVPIDESLDLFEAGRRSNVRLFRMADPAMMENFGMHEERGRESVASLVRLTAGHDVNHLRQVEGLLAARP